MKKLFIGILFLIVSSVAFAEVFYEGKSEQILDLFWEKGNVIKIIQDENNIQYINKSFIQTIAIDEDDMKIQCYTSEDMILLVGSVKNDNNMTFNIDKCNISSDDKGNIIIVNIPKSKKKK